MGDSKYDRWQFHQVLMPSSVLYVIYWLYPVIHWAQHLSSTLSSSVALL